MPDTEPTRLLDQLRTARRLPSPPGIALRVLDLCRREDTDVQQIADAIMSDPALSSRLLRYANSSIVGAGRKVTSVRDAVLLLGLRAVKLTALGFSIASPDLQPRCPGFELRRFWLESFATAAIARRLAGDQVKVDREEAFTAGLLAGIGRLALAHGLAEEYGEVLESAREGQSLIEAERAVLGIDHVHFGAELLADWGLPDVLVEAVRQQIQPIDPGSAEARRHPLAYVVRLSIRLAPLFAGTPEGLTAETRTAAREVIEKALQLDEQAWQRIADETLTDFCQVGELFDVQLEGHASVFDLYAEAQEEATRVGMVAQLERTKALEENKALLLRASTDPLTGVANRAKFEERVQEAMAGLRRGQGHCAIVLADIDHFKRFNDAYGHDVGDIVLKQVALTLQSVLRDVDLLARYGGEEFIILAPHTDQRGACTIAARIRRCVDELQVNAQNEHLHVTISVGLAVSSDYREIPSQGQILSDADKQLYLSKRAGRNTWSYLGRSACQVARATAPV
jgi:diguanylate cyclase (GGDEF)-like protein